MTVPLLTIALICYSVTILYRPHWGINLILFLLPVYQIRFTVLGLPTTLLEWMIVLLAATVAINFLRYPGLRHRTRLLIKKIPWITLAIAIFLLAGVISTAVSPVPLKAAGIFKAYIFEGALFFALYLLLIDTKEKLYQTFFSLGFLIISLAVFGIVQFFTLYRLPPAWWGPGLEPRRVVSLYTYPNAVALLITPLLSLFTALVLFRDRLGTFLTKKFLLSVLVLGLPLLLLTFSRGGWIGYCTALIFLMLFSRYKKVGLVAVAVAFLALLAFPATHNRLLPLLTGTDPAGLERLKLYQAAAEIIKHRPLVGAGLMGFREQYTQLRQSPHDDILNYPHNFFLNFWTETGPVGLLAIIAMLLWTGRSAWQLINHENEHRALALATLAAFIALLAHGMVDVPFFKNDLSILFWFLLALIPTLLLLQNRQTE